MNKNDYQTPNVNSNIRYYKPMNTDENVYYETRIPYGKNKLKDFLALIITIVFIIGVGFLLWKIPFTNKLLVNIYENNQPIKAIVDVILKLLSIDNG